uniref:Uncharacterized protein n=1 Tax=Varanus komodoensis TaxID=61221 RepID=A0A8D2J6J8_VARKO
MYSNHLYCPTASINALTKRDPLEKEMATHSSTLAMKTPWTVPKGKKIRCRKMRPSGRKVSTMLLGKSRGLVLVAPERMKRLGQSRKDIQSLMYLVVKGESDAAKIYTP